MVCTAIDWLELPIDAPFPAFLIRTNRSRDSITLIDVFFFIILQDCLDARTLKFARSEESDSIRNKFR